MTKTQTALWAVKMHMAYAAGIANVVAVYKEYVAAGGLGTQLLDCCLFSNDVKGQIRDWALGLLTMEAIGLAPRIRHGLMKHSLVEQKAFCDNGVEVALPGADVRTIKLLYLTPRQRMQVFGPAGLRAVAEQRVFLDEERLAAAAREKAFPEQGHCWADSSGKYVNIGASSKTTRIAIQVMIRILESLGYEVRKK